MPTEIWYSTDSASEPRTRIEVDMPPWTFPDTHDHASDVAGECAEHFAQGNNEWPDKSVVEFYLFRDDDPQTSYAWRVHIEKCLVPTFTSFLTERKPANKPKADAGMQVSDTVVFELGEDGTNRIYAHVQAGGAHGVSKEDLERTARRFAYSAKLEELVRELARAPEPDTKLSPFDYLIRKATYLVGDMDEGR